MGERLLWSTRLLLVAGVAGACALCAAVVWMATVDLVVLVGDVVEYTTAADRSAVRSGIVADVVKVVDTYLLAAILVLVAFGLYELFVSRIDARPEGDGDGRRLTVGSLDDLKDKIAKLVILILVIEVFQRALKLDVEDPAGLALLAGSIALVSLALLLPNVVRPR